METPINYPFIMMEKEDYFKLNTSDDLSKYRFNFITSEKKFNKHEITYDEPFAIYFYEYVNKGAELKGYKWNNQLKAYLK